MIGRVGAEVVIVTETEIAIGTGIAIEIGADDDRARS
jgi:hypothetical protein